jgi:UDP-N-acetylmuramoyl-tripeptide--D-alanyl-D-alanine ligase
VPDALETLQKLATYHRNQFKIPVIAITGSNGKTTTKELVAAVLASKYKVCATQGNFNNHIGVPLTLLTISDHDIAIIEMGANHIGEIADLCKIANPDFGIITNIGKAHLEGFGSPEGVIQAKSELYDHLSIKKGKVFIDSESPLLRSLGKIRNLETIFYGEDADSICKGELAEKSKFLNVNISISGFKDVLNIKTSLVGSYNMKNILAAVCIGSYFGVTPGNISSALSEYTPVNSRSQLLITSKNRIVFDAYNANPSSMESSVSNFLSMNEELPKMIILGDMLELGKYSREEHQLIVKYVKDQQFSNIILVGSEFCSVSSYLSMPCFKNVDELIEHFLKNPVKEHSILLKGSRGIKLEKLLKVL